MRPCPEDVRAAIRWRWEKARKPLAFGRMKGDKTVLRYRCGWCGNWMQGEPEGRYVESTGMCGSCRDDVLEEAGL